MMKKPYLKKLGKAGRYSIYEVDGEWIRANKDIEFTNYAYHDLKSYVPKFEIWLDVEESPDEGLFFINRILVEELMKEHGINGNKPYRIAEDVDKSIRAFQGLRKKDIHIKILGYRDGYTVWLVDGDAVRTIYDQNFTEGAHHLAKHYVPKMEVWIDNDLPEHERPDVIDHEFTELIDMRDNGTKYDLAHRRASAKELKDRRNGSVIDA